VTGAIEYVIACPQTPLILPVIAPGFFGSILAINLHRAGELAPQMEVA
jgi:hypothetical protein